MSEWLAALKLEERRQVAIYSMMDAGVGLAGLSMILLSLYWSVLDDERVFGAGYGGIILLLALIGVPQIMRGLSHIGLANKRLFTTVETSGVSEQLLAGEITGNELYSAFPRMWRWLVPPQPHPDPVRVLRRVCIWANYYAGSRETALMPIYFSIMALFYCIGGLASCLIQTLDNSWAIPGLQQSMAFRGIIMGIGIGVSMTLVVLMQLRSNTIFYVLPVLKRQWVAELASQQKDSAGGDGAAGTP